MIKKFDEFQNINESIKLTDDEKKYLWTKIEYNKKKQAILSENDLYNLLNSEKTKFDDKEFDLILKSLEYTFRKKLSGMDSPLKSEIFNDIQKKIPKDWIGVKYSSLSAKKKRDEKEDNEK